MRSSELVTPQHLARKAVIYVRQSTPNQVLTNREQTCSQTLRSMAVATMRGIGDVLARVLRVAPRPR